MKTCSTCGESKPLSEFQKRATSRDGHKPACKVCSSKSYRKWRKANLESVRERKRKWRDANSESERERRRKWRAANSEREAEQGRKWYQNNLERVRERSRKRKYGLDTPTFEAMLVGQHYCCAICNTSIDDSSNIDHCHTTGIVRGLLCSACNKGLGHFKDDVQLLASAIDYLHTAMRQAA